MNLDDLALGWREALIAAIACLVLYVVFAVLRLRRLRRQPAATAPADSSQLHEPAEPVAVVKPPAREELPFPWYEPPDEVPPPASGGAESALDAALLARLESRLAAAERVVAECSQLRDEVAIMRGELASIRIEMTKQLERMQATQNIAPIYGDAMQMAAAGYDAAAIAERCGVARAEADLVVALMRSQARSENMREK